MSYYRGLIEESEKKRILDLHNKNRKNSTIGLLKEALTDFPFCVRKAAGGNIHNDGKNDYILVKNGGGQGIDYYWGTFKNKYLYVVGYNDGLRTYKYHCKCVNGKCQVNSYDENEKDRQDECNEKKSCSTQQGTTPSGQKGGDCSKGPMDLVVSMGLNWKETRQKWVDTKCNGTTPCVLGDVKTNINLRNALCGGIWNPKNDGTTTTNTPQGRITRSREDQEMIDQGLGQ